jgi:hypothetical protein
MTLFRPILDGHRSPQVKPNPVEALVIKTLGILFTGRSTQEYAACVHQLISAGMFEKYIERAGGKFKEIGVAACLAVLASLLEFGASRPKGGPSRSIIRRALDHLRQQRLARDGVSETARPTSSSTQPEIELSVHEHEMSSNAIAHACKITFGILSVGLSRPNDKNVVPMIHAYFAFIKCVAMSDIIMQHIERDIPWQKIVDFLNFHANSKSMTAKLTRTAFPKPDGDDIGRPLPEDFIMRGQIFYDDYYPKTWFQDAAVDDEERVLELASMALTRLERVLWNGCCISTHKKWIVYHPETFKFETTPYVKNLIPHDLPTSFEPGTLPEEVENMEPLDEDITPYSVPDSPPPKVSTPVKAYSTEEFSPKPFSQPTKILKRKSKEELLEPRSISPKPNGGGIEPTSQRQKITTNKYFKSEKYSTPHGSFDGISIVDLTNPVDTNET